MSARARRRRSWRGPSWPGRSRRGPSRRGPAASLAVLAVTVLAIAALAGCGQERQVREPDMVVAGRAPAAATPRPPDPARRSDAVRIAVVTHGQASSSFWVVVRNGIDAAARQVDASVSYRSPDTYSVARMSGLIDAAVATRPDGLVVTIPSPGLAPAIRRAVAAGIPVVSINSGTDLFRRLGVLAHIGQQEERAGAAAGRRLARAGVRRGLCVNHETGNAALKARCRAFARALNGAGGTAAEVAVDLQDRARTRQRLASVVRARRIDGILTLNTDGAVAALDATRGIGAARRPRLATFDLSPEVLEALKAGRIGFAVDQQAYLQGYLPVMLLTQRARFGLFASEGRVFPTGPSFVTRETAGEVISLSNRGIR
jgi:simple sugar transport system substrate-binding protein